MLPFCLSRNFGLSNEPYPNGMVGRRGIAYGHAERLGCSQEFPRRHVHPIQDVHTCARVGPITSPANMFVRITNLIQKAMIRGENCKSHQSKASSKTTQPKRLHTAMATTSASFSMLGWVGRKKAIPRHKIYTVMAQQQAEVQQQQQPPPQQQQANAQKQQPVSLPQQPMAKSKNMFREYGGQWLSSVTRHVRIYAAYIDPVTNAFDQTQMDKLTLILDPTNEFVWTPETCNKVYTNFQELVDHYEVL